MFEYECCDAANNIIAPSCCGTQPFDPETQLCCFGGSENDFELLSPPYNDPNTNYVTVDKTTSLDRFCCASLTQPDTYTPWEQINQSCCNGQVIDKSTAICCGGPVEEEEVVVTKASQGTRNDEECCGTGIPGDEYFPYFYNTELCCYNSDLTSYKFYDSSSIPDTITFAQCCGTDFFDFFAVTCCNDSGEATIDEDGVGIATDAGFFQGDCSPFAAPPSMPSASPTDGISSCALQDDTVCEYEAVDPTDDTSPLIPKKVAICTSHIKDNELHYHNDCVDIDELGDKGPDDYWKDGRQIINCGCCVPGSDPIFDARIDSIDENYCLNEDCYASAVTGDGDGADNVVCDAEKGKVNICYMDGSNDDELKNKCESPFWRPYKEEDTFVGCGSCNVDDAQATTASQKRKHRNRSKKRLIRR